MRRYSRAEKAQQRRQALELMLAGQSDLAIAQALGVAKNTAQARIRQALAEQQPHEDVERYRTRQLAENEIRRRKLMRGITRASAADDWQALSSLNRTLTHLHEREARMLNLDAVPTPADRLRSMSDAELEALLADAEEEHPDAGDVVANA